MKGRRLLYLVAMGSVAIVAFAEMQFAHKASQQTVVRQIKGLSTGYRAWFLTSHGRELFVIDGGSWDTKLWQPQLPVPTLHRVFRVDTDKERVMEEFITKHTFAQAILAEREQRPDSWLAQEYGYWLLDEKTNTAYAVKVIFEVQFWSERYPQVEVIDLPTRQLKKVIKLLPEASFGAFALHLNKIKFYLSVGERDTGGSLWVYDTATLERIKIIQLNSDLTIKDIHFSKDGRYLFGSERNIVIIDTDEDRIIGLINPPRDRMFTPSIALSPDEREIYVGLQFGMKKGAVAAIDIAQKKLVRVLEISPTGCTSVAVVRNKLFAACLDGVYVIDIPAWRQQ